MGRNFDVGGCRRVDYYGVNVQQDRMGRLISYFLVMSVNIETIEFNELISWPDGIQPLRLERVGGLDYFIIVVSKLLTS
jgi:hypothetical protein